MVSRLALRLKADTEGRWSPPCCGGNRVGRLFSAVNWRPTGASLKADHITAELGCSTAPPPPTTEALAKSLSACQHFSSRTLPSCPHSWSLLFQMKAEGSSDSKGVSAPPAPNSTGSTHIHARTHTHTHSRPQLLRTLPLPSPPWPE